MGSSGSSGSETVAAVVKDREGGVLSLANVPFIV